jgi:hypothetical protein
MDGGLPAKLLGDLLIFFLLSKFMAVGAILANDIMAEGVQTDSHFLNNFFTMNMNSESPKEAYRKVAQRGIWMAVCQPNCSATC